MNRTDTKRAGTDFRVPRTRGDEPYGDKVDMNLGGVFPAHAGMNRFHASPYVIIDRVPRTRGDEPSGRLIAH